MAVATFLRQFFRLHNMDFLPFEHDIFLFLFQNEIAKIFIFYGSLNALCHVQVYMNNFFKKGKENKRLSFFSPGQFFSLIKTCIDTCFRGDMDKNLYIRFSS